MGDTGYSQDFSNIGEPLGPIDLSAIPIGAYEPRWFMRATHVCPEEAVKIHMDVKSRYSVGMHWGTFIISDEDMDDPPKRLAECLRKMGISEEEFFFMQPGETLHLDFIKN
ncbi:MAG TPA: MBL fold metallo-hydrolase [Thermodesulfobacteriota bacterium]|nr:MBL fold metallo-hydrolase [Thermodesulfobacteriota bacterium]